MDDFIIIMPNDFLIIGSFEYSIAVHARDKAENIELYFRKVFEWSLWPRIFISKCSLVISSLIKAFSIKDLMFIRHLLLISRKILSYIGFFLHGIRLIVNIGHLGKVIFLGHSGAEELKHNLNHKWFELFTDFQSFINIFIPATYLFASLALIIVEQSLTLLSTYIEKKRLYGCIKGIDDALQIKNLESSYSHELVEKKSHYYQLIFYTHKKLILNLGISLITTFLFVVKNLILPLLILSTPGPVFFLFALLSFGFTLADHYLNKYLDESKSKEKESVSPQEKVIVCKEQGFFAAPTKIQIGSTSDDNSQHAELIIKK